MAFWIFQNIVITAALAAAVALVCRSGRLGPVARHALWVLVLVKFVTPPLFVWPWAAPDPLGIAAIDTELSDRLITTSSDIDLGPDLLAPRTSDSADVTLSSRSSNVSNALNVLDVRSGSRDQSPYRSSAAAWPWLLAIWAVGSLAVLGIEGVRVARLTRRIRASRVASQEDIAIAHRVTELSARLGIRSVPVVMMTGTSTPAVWGLGRPVLLWPASLSADSTDACIDGLLVHELAHVKRGDHLVGWIELAAGVVWWWNPLFWFVRSALREQAELACDAWVISALPNGRRAYAESLLALSGASHLDASSSPSMAAVGIRATSRRVLERRLVMIMKGRAPLRLPFVGLFCLALVGAATLPAWATAQYPPQAQPQTPPPTVPAVVPPATTVPAPTGRPATPAPTARRPGDARAPVPASPIPYVTGTPQAPQTPPPAAPGIRTPSTMSGRPAPAQDPKTAPVPARKPSSASPVWLVTGRRPTNMPAEGLALLDNYDKDREAIQKEIDQKLAARRDAAIKALQDLQDQYTKAGKLDEAVIIRDYLRSGGPASNGVIRFNRVTKR